MDEKLKQRNLIKARAIDTLADMDAKDIDSIIILIDQKHGDKFKLHVAFAGDPENLVACCGEFLRALAGTMVDENPIRH